jgi:hypothetical protein
MRTILKRILKNWVGGCGLFCLYQNKDKYRSPVNTVTNKDPSLPGYYGV